MKRNFFLFSGSDEDKGENKYVKKLWSYIKWAIVAIVIVWPLSPTFFPYHPISGFWFVKGDVIDWVKSSYYLFLWAIAINLIVVFTSKNREYSHTPAQIMKKGFWVSLFAGVSEEIIFRWIIFLGAMVSLYVTNWILGGFLGSEWGIVRWFNNLIKIPIANYMTLGLLKPQIIDSVWYAGAGLILSNGLFRDGHKYQGFIGFLNSWFGGMFLFYIMFKYGLLAAIFVHFMYDILCYSVAFVETLFFQLFTGIQIKNRRKETPWQKKLRELQERRNY